MSQENIELVRHALQAYNSGDVDAFVDLFTDDGEVETDPTLTIARWGTACQRPFRPTVPLRLDQPESRRWRWSTRLK
jgi:hypothetical protein